MQVFFTIQPVLPLDDACFAVAGRRLLQILLKENKQQLAVLSIMAISFAENFAGA
jgi:hypothetical protein